MNSNKHSNMHYLVVNDFFDKIVNFSTKPRVKLSVCKVNETTIAPRENVTYSKETQTSTVETGDREGQFFSLCVFLFFF